MATIARLFVTLQVKMLVTIIINKYIWNNKMLFTMRVNWDCLA